METMALPGQDLVEKGIRDLAEGTETVESLLVSLAAPALRSIGLEIPTTQSDPELRLYCLLTDSYGDASHSKYNALVRRIVSYRRASACAR